MGDEIERLKNAVQNGNLQVVENLLRKGVDPREFNNWGILNEI